MKTTPLLAELNPHRRRCRGALPAMTAPALRHCCAIIAAFAMVVATGCARHGGASDGPIVVHGTIESVDARLSFKVPGRLIERRVDEGATVKTGESVAQLDDTELQQELAVRRAELASVEAALAELEAGTRPQEIAAAEAALQSAEAEQQRAQLEFNRQKELRASDVISQRDLDNARAQIDVAAARVRELGQRLDLLRAGPRAETIDQARARVGQARAAVALAGTRVANARLEAPFDGVVLAKHAEPGEFLAAGVPVVTISDIAHVWVRGYIAQTDLGHLRLGQAVEVRTDSNPEKTYTGRLGFISSEAEFTPKTVQTEKERVTLVFRIKVDLDNASGELKPGMAADAVLARAAAEGS